jgi:hypothetical protein
MIAPRPWLGISTRDWFINSDTPHPARARQRLRETKNSVSGMPKDGTDTQTSPARPAITGTKIAEK